MEELWVHFFFFQAEDGIRDLTVTGVQTCALPICQPRRASQALRLVRSRTTVAGTERTPGSVNAGARVPAHSNRFAKSNRGSRSNRRWPPTETHACSRSLPNPLNENPRPDRRGGPLSDGPLPDSI